VLRVRRRLPDSRRATITSTAKDGFGEHENNGELPETKQGARDQREERSKERLEKFDLPELQEQEHDSMQAVETVQQLWQNV